MRSPLGALFYVPIASAPLLRSESATSGLRLVAWGILRRRWGAVAGALGGAEVALHLGCGKPLALDVGRPLALLLAVGLSGNARGKRAYT